MRFRITIELTRTPKQTEEAPEFEHRDKIQPPKESA